MLNVWYSVYSIHHSYYYITSTNVKKEMGKGREEGSELTLNFYYMPGALQLSIYSFEVGFIHSFSPAHLPLCPFTEDINEHDKCHARGDH